MRINERICFLNKQMFIECPYASYTGERAVSKTKSLPSPHPSSGSVHSTFVIAVVQLLSHVQLFETPLTAACQAPLSFTTSWSLVKFIGYILSGISVSWFMEGKTKQEAAVYYGHVSGCVRQKDVLLKSSCKHINAWSFTKHIVTFSGR